MVVYPLATVRLKVLYLYLLDIAGRLYQELFLGDWHDRKWLHELVTLSLALLTRLSEVACTGFRLKNSVSVGLFILIH